MRHSGGERCDFVESRQDVTRILGRFVTIHVEKTGTAENKNRCFVIPGRGGGGCRKRPFGRAAAAPDIIENEE